MNRLQRKAQQQLEKLRASSYIRTELASLQNRGSALLDDTIYGQVELNATSTCQIYVRRFGQLVNYSQLTVGYG